MANAEIKIDTCKLEELQEVQHLQNEWVVEDIAIGLLEADIEYLKSKIGKYFVVAKYNNEIIGYALGTLGKAKNMAIFEDDEIYIEIDDLYVKIDYRAEGVGTNLLDELLNRAAESNINRSLLYSSIKDIDSVKRFYEKFGYKSWYIQMYK